MKKSYLGEGPSAGPGWMDHPPVELKASGQTGQEKILHTLKNPTLCFHIHLCLERGKKGLLARGTDQKGQSKVPWPSQKATDGPQACILPDTIGYPPRSRHTEKSLSFSVTSVWESSTVVGISYMLTISLGAPGEPRRPSHTRPVPPSRTGAQSPTGASTLGELWALLFVPVPTAPHHLPHLLHWDTLPA